MKQIITNKELQVLLKDVFIKCFWIRIRSNFEFLSWSMRFQQNSKNFEILIDFNQNLILFQTKATNFHNEFYLNHVSKKYETNYCKQINANTFER